VVLLDCALSEAERWLGHGLVARALSQAKFTSMLMPEELAELELQLIDRSLRFAITRGGQPIAQGAFTLEPLAHETAMANETAMD
jgi:hypothetical protein